MSFTSYAAAPANDLCGGAILLIADGSCLLVDNTDATPSAHPTPTLSCGSFGASSDMWFKVAVPLSGNVVIETEQPPAGISDVDMEAYIGNSCGSLVPIACNHNKEVGQNSNAHAIIELENQVVGDTIWIRVMSNTSGEYRICANDDSPIYTCRIDLITLGGQSPCDPLTNSFNQNLIVNYRTDGSATELILNNRYFPITGSPQTVLIPDLPANNSQVDVYGHVSGVNNCGSNSFYDSMNLITAPSNCFTGTVVNDSCNQAIVLPVTNNCGNQIFDMTGATLSEATTFCGEVFQDIWFSFVVPVSGEVLIYSYYGADVNPDYQLFAGDCTSKTFIDCGYVGTVTRISNRTPGETIFIKVYPRNADEQGELGICILEVEEHLNDICTDAIDLVVGSCNGNVYSTHLANSEGNPTLTSLCDNSTNPSRDIWFKAIMPPSGSMAVFTEEVFSEYASIVLEAFQGDCSSLTQVDCAFENLNNGHSLVNLTGAPGLTYYFRVSRRGGSVTTFGICATIVENDLCIDATPLPVDGSCLTTSNIGASSSNNPMNNLICSDSSTVNDLWFSAVVPPSGNLTIESKMVTEGLNDVVMEAFQGDCTALTYLACNDNKESYPDFDGHSLIELEDLTPGSVIYIRIGARYSNELGEFEICASDIGYSYPCRIYLIELGNQSSCDPSTNSYSQELIVHYRSDMNSEILEINGQSTFLTTSPQAVVLTNLPANGRGLHVDARLQGSDSECVFNSSYHAFNFVIAPPNCYSGEVVNDVCQDAIMLPVTNACVDGIYDLTGANAPIDLNSCWGIKQDVWFSFVIPPSGDVVINTFHHNGSSIFPNFDIYKGECDGLVFIDCGQWIRSERLIGRTPGEVIYVRVTDHQTNQGTFSICIMEVAEHVNEICDTALNIPFIDGCHEILFSNHIALGEGHPTDRISCDLASGLSLDQWFKIEVPSEGRMTIYVETIENGFSPEALEVYEGNCDGLTSIGCDISTGINGKAVVTVLDKTPGSVLYLRVAQRGFFDPAVFKICLEIVENDLCENAQNLQVLSICDPDSVNLSIHGSSMNPTPDPHCISGTPQSDAWYKIEVQDEDDFVIRTVSLESNEYSDAIIELYTNNCNDLQQFACSAFNEPLSNASIILENRSIGETIFVRVLSANGNPISFGICAIIIPINDICSESIFIGTGECNIYNMQDVRASNNPTAGLSCGSYLGEISQDGMDIWFNTTVPASGNLSIETNQVGGGIEDVDVEIYTGDCNSLTPIACNTNKELFAESNDHVRIELENQIPGQTLFIRILSTNTDYGLFELCIADEPPSGDCAITFISTQGSGVCRFDSISFGQDLLVYYHNDGSATALSINNQTFPISSSPQLVTLKNLLGNGNDIGVVARLVSPRSDCQINSTYMAEHLIDGTLCVPTNNVCETAITLGVGDVCQEEIFDLTNSFFSGSFITNPFSCFDAGEYPKDVWFTFEVPANGEAVVNTFIEDIEVTFEIYAGTCNNGFQIVETCGAPWSSIRVSGRTAGEILYIRVADMNGDEDGRFGLCVLEVEEFTNDLCINAIELPLTDNCNGPNYSGHFSFADEHPSASLSCDLSGASSKDMWFRIPVTESSDITIFTEEVERGYSDLELEIYTGDCSNLTSIYCDFSSGADGHGLVNVSGVELQDLYVRVAGYGGVFNDAFKICAIPECVEYWDIFDPIDGDYVYVAEDSINSSSTIVTGSNVKFDAGVEINIFTNFEIESGALFEVGLVGCSNQ